MPEASLHRHLYPDKNIRYVKSKANFKKTLIIVMLMNGYNLSQCIPELVKKEVLNFLFYSEKGTYGNTEKKPISSFYKKYG